MKFQNRNLNNILKYLILIVTLVLLVAALFGILFSNETAFADDNVSIVFPTTGYIQSATPSHIAANADYLLIYDSGQGKLYARSNAQLGTKSYDALIDNVSNLFAVGKQAFFVAENGYYALDLTAQNPIVEQVTLTTPDEISYLTSDGTYLYAKSAFGYITIYDDNFDVALGQDNVRDVSLTGNSVILGNSENIYIFTASYGDPHYTILNLPTKNTDEKAISSSVQAASIGDETIIFASIGGAIACLDKSTGEPLFISEIAPDAFASYGRNLFTIEGNNINVYSVSNDVKNFTRSSSMAMTGGDEKHLNNPVDIEKLSNKYAIADANNNRIAYYSGNNELSTFSLDTTPKHLAHDGNILYIACDNEILKLNSLYIEQRYSMSDVLDILYLDKLYVLKADGIYVLFSGEFVKLYDIQNAICLAGMEDGQNVFIGTNQEIVVIDSTGTKLPTNLVGDFTNLKDLAVDYFGNIIVAYEMKVEVFKNNIDSLEFVSTTNLEGDYRVNLNACIIDGSNLYYTADESYVGKAVLNVTTKDNYIIPGVQPSENYELKVANTGSYVLPKDCRNGNIKSSTSKVLMAFESSTTPQGYVLVYDGIDYQYIPENALQNANCESLSGEYVSTKQTVLFVTPNKDSQDNVVLDENSHVIFKQGTAGFDGGNWVIVEYQNKEYFAKQNEFSEYVAPVPERKANYGRAKGTRVGGIVNVYQSASTESAVILEIADGAKVEILETLDDFYKVSVNGTVGYMTKDEVQLGGLTTVQIVAIILAVLVLLAGSAVFVAIYFTKKKDAENLN